MEEGIGRIVDTNNTRYFIILLQNVFVTFSFSVYYKLPRSHLTIAGTRSWHIICCYKYRSNYLFKREHNVYGTSIYVPLFLTYIMHWGTPDKFYFIPVLLRMITD